MIERVKQSHAQYSLSSVHSARRRRAVNRSPMYGDKYVRLGLILLPGNVRSEISETEGTIRVLSKLCRSGKFWRNRVRR